MPNREDHMSIELPQPDESILKRREQIVAGLARFSQKTA